MYVIVTDSIKQHGVSLFLVDRSKTKSSWWETKLSNNVLYMYNLRKALRICSKLKHNNPRVVTVEEARKLSNKNESIRDVMTMFDDHPFNINNSENS